MDSVQFPLNVAMVRIILPEIVARFISTYYINIQQRWIQNDFRYVCFYMYRINIYVGYIYSKM